MHSTAGTKLRNICLMWA